MRAERAGAKLYLEGFHSYLAFNIYATGAPNADPVSEGTGGTGFCGPTPNILRMGLAELRRRA